MINIGKYIEMAINWLTENFAGLFDVINHIVGGFIDGFQGILMWVPFYLMIAGIAALAWWKAGKGTAVLTLLGLLLIWGMGFWVQTMQTVALVLSSTIIALLLGVPLGIWTGRNDKAAKVIRPVLDLMQTMPAFVYLIPAVLFFGLGPVPGAFATVIFAMPPVVRLTDLGIRQVPEDIVEADKQGIIHFHDSDYYAQHMHNCDLVNLEDMLQNGTVITGTLIERPHSFSTACNIANQTIMMALSMVVIAAMISAGGLGEIVLKGITQMKIGLGFEGGIAVVILAIVLDRITQGFVRRK